MKVGIICAGDTELAPFLPIIKDGKTSEKAMLRIYEGKIENVNVVTLFCGVCKVNAAIATQILIDTYQVDMIINAGTAGGMDSKLDIFDTVISMEVAYHDVHEEILTEFHPWMENVFFKADKELLKLSEKAVANMKTDYKILWGRMVTGEAFITDEGRDEINAQFGPLTVDMETGSIAHVCYVNKVPFIAIRSITDTPSHSGSEYFEKNCEKASIIAKDITVALLAEIRDK
ncbi:MAG: 5'-methylthioadenosine/S-adenosylhomocysteine nucleosidase [Lachnospiraceae bacterium]|nr:5'-methylthioadenosine/S-adenosylhomocysteine nucleosidase [Lachnospiraceae bacterium]